MEIPWCRDTAPLGLDILQKEEVAGSLLGICATVPGFPVP